MVKKTNANKDAIRDLVSEVLAGLDAIYDEHPELGDTVVREIMQELIYRGFVRRKKGFRLPDSVGMYTKKADRRVKKVLRRFFSGADRWATKAGLKEPQARLDALEDLADITSPSRTIWTTISTNSAPTCWRGNQSRRRPSPRSPRRPPSQGRGLRHSHTR